MAILFRTDLTMKEITPKNGSDFSLKELYEILDCDSVEVVPLTEINSFVVDEEGKLKDKECNMYASKIYQKFLNTTDVLVGDCLMINNEEIK